MASGAGSAALGGRNQGRRMGLDFVRKKDSSGGGLGGGAKGDSKAEKAEKKLAKSENAAANLASAERVAETKPSQAEDSLDGARENETAAGGFYSGTGKPTDKGEKGKGLKAGFLKKKGPMGLIIGLILGVGGVIGGSQSLQLFSFADQLRSTFNSMETAADLRANKFFNLQMESGRTKNPLKAKLFGGSKFVITKKQRTKLETQGIYVDDDFEGTGMRVLKFDDGTGKIQIVAPDQKTAAKLDALDLKNLDGDTTLGMKYSDTAITFKNLYAENSDFFYGYNKGSRTWRGAISGWFGSVTTKFLQSNKLTRNLFKNYQEEVEKAGKGNSKKVATELMAERESRVDTEGDMEKANQTTEEVDNGDGTTTEQAKVDTEVDADGKTKVNTTSVELSTKKMTAAEVQTKMNDISNKFGAGDAAAKVVNTACLVSDVVGAISLLVSASEALQIISLITGYLEAIDKTKAGDGDNSPINEFANSLNETRTIEYSQLELSDNTIAQGSDYSNISQADIEGAFDNEATVTKTGSAMTSSGVASLYGGGSVNPNDASVKSLNFSSSINTIMTGIGVSMTAFETCALAKMTAATAGLIKDGIEIGACIIGVVGAIFSFGTSTAACGPAIKSAVIGIAASVGLGLLISGIIAAITPMVTQSLTRDLISNIGGEDLGNALTSGANMYMGNTHRSNGGSLATKDEYIAFAAEQQKVIADNAKYERMDRSPFDVTSQYTFLGTLATQLQAFSSSNTIMSTLMSSGSVISSALTSLVPTSSAVEIADHLYDADDYEKICPYLASIGAVGDAFCNPYIITDVSTMDTDPADVIDKVDSFGNNFENEEGDNVKIVEGSDLAKYILYCNNRTSQFGIADQNIVNSVAGAGTTSSSVANSAIGAVPILGDAFDIYNNKESIANAGYISGETCVAGNDTVDGESYSQDENNEDILSETPSWSKAKYYQRFIEDQSLAETMGLIEESAVTAYLDEYYEENPLDQSYEGILARYSGLEKEDVVALLEIVEYGNYIANYDASTRYAFVENNEGGERIFFEKNNEFEQMLGAPIYAIVYSDLRNRNFVA